MTGARRRPVLEALVRLGLGASIGVAAMGGESAFGSEPGLESLRLIAAGAFCAGLFYGWSGATGFAFATALIHSFGPPASPPEVAARVALAQLALGWLAYGVFRRFLLDRGLRDLRSFLGLLAAAALAGGLAAVLTTPLRLAAGNWAAVSTWWATFLTSVALLVPPVAVVTGGHRLPYAAPLSVASRPGAGPRPGAVRGRPWLDWVGPIALVVLITALLRVVGSHLGGLEAWLVALYVAPFLWAADRRGLRGGILVGCAAGLGYLAARSVEFGPAASWHSRIVGQQAGALGLVAVGALLGSNRQVERRLRRELQAANERLRVELRNVVDALRSALGAKDAYTEGHVGRVASYALATGRRLGMASDQLELLEVASLLHDVGKIGIPEEILHKDGSLDERERTIMQRHPEIGARILDDLEELRAAAPLVRHHQERFDGRTDCRFPGYPDGLAGDGIPLGARVIAVVDAFDAMTSNRSYRPALAVREAIAELRRERGAQFDPGVVDVFLTVVDERPWIR